MTHPYRGGHTRKTGFPDIRIRMNRDGSEKKITYIKSYILYKLQSLFYKNFCTTTPSRGSLSKSMYFEVQLVKEPLERVVVQKNL